MLVFRIPTKLLGIPLSFLLLFGAWAGFIFILRKLVNHSKQPKV
jgi:predicted permease